MTIAKRLKNLEQKHPDRIADAMAWPKLIAALETNYKRVEGQAISQEWLSRQSHVTAMAIGMCGPLPHAECVDARLRQIAEIENPSGKLASLILELAP